MDRHLRFLLLFSPRSLFLYSGFTLFSLGLLSMSILLPKPVMLFGVSLDTHTLIYSSIVTVIGLQLMLFWVFAKIYGQREGIVPPDPAFDMTLQQVTLERGLITGVAVLLVCWLRGLKISRGAKHWESGIGSQAMARERRIGA